jgi:hypothetical protein
MRARGSFSGSIRNISPIRNFSPDARRLLDAAKQTQAQKAAEVALSLRRAATFKRTDSGRIEIATAAGVKRRTWNFGKRVVAGFRSEHTIGSFLYPQDVETASLTDPQIGQIFWNMVRCITPLRARPLHMHMQMRTCACTCCTCTCHMHMHMSHVLMRMCMRMHMHMHM